MRFKNLMILTAAALFILAACGEKKRKETEKDAIEEIKIEKENLEATLLKTEDSMRQVRADSIRRDSVTKDSLRQVKEHGHAH